MEEDERDDTEEGVKKKKHWRTESNSGTGLPC